ncbi:hypothetical protein Rhe02_96300 [Rhizocola hellebori]|uniref:DEAD/DEAH box helicase n=1 Tax=Rhizocola hellebori TaxID=1392758 RepID=A0A8J3VMX3_9ACTN|nr:DEAD/DEAH box helicase [Rhizocola hellebori]GIH11563.1 hypothetical protein Rhe02_96300 [Rhizocola hellebori]
MHRLPDWLQRDQVTHVEVFPARAGSTHDWPAWTAPALIDALAKMGIDAPWAHQTIAAQHAHEGRDVVIATGTGSGKSLAYHLPALSAVLSSPKARVLYLAPTKALAIDQMRSLQDLNLPGLRAAACDGDTLREHRDWIRQHANVVLTNPDLLHHSLLPQHGRWSALLRQLRYVIVDESHSYRGVFGAHVAHILRRLRRLTADRPTFLLASATSADPAASATKLVGRPVIAVSEDTAPRGQSTFVLWEPPFLPGRGPLEPARSVPPQRQSGSDQANTANHQQGHHADAHQHSYQANAHGHADSHADAHSHHHGHHTKAHSHADAHQHSYQADAHSHADGLQGDAGGQHGDQADADGHHVDSDAARHRGFGQDWELDGAPVRRSALRETGDLLADAVSRGIRTLAFVPSRRGAEVVALQARRELEEVQPGLGQQVAAYRAGYLSEERRALERALTVGELTGLATTNALELGIDVTGLDAVLLAGYPGTRTAMWQRAGRAGRAGRDGICVLVARDDPLDTYLVHHPAALFHTPVEATVFDPDNPYVLAPHLCTAAAEKPLTLADLQLFGAPQSLVEDLVAQGALRQRPTGWYWTHPTRPEIDIRGTGGQPVAVIEAATGRLIGTANAGSAHHQLHQGAVYTHQGRTYVVTHLDLDDSVAFVEADNPPHTTHARDTTSLDVLTVRSRVEVGPVSLFLGDVEVTSQVVSFQKRRMDSGEVLGTWPLDLPPRTLRTVAVWTTLADEAVAELEDLPGALHAAEHAAIGLLPLVASCDRWDIGGLSIARHADTDAPTIFVYDGHPGGAGFAERAFHMAQAWLTATRDTVKSCACERGCPSCVQSPKCGNGNNPLDKQGAIAVLTTILSHLPTPAPLEPQPTAPEQLQQR